MKIIQRTSQPTNQQQKSHQLNEHWQVVVVVSHLSIHPSIHSSIPFLRFIHSNKPNSTEQNNQPTNSQSNSRFICSYGCVPFVMTVTQTICLSVSMSVCLFRMKYFKAPSEYLTSLAYGRTDG